MSRPSQSVSIARAETGRRRVFRTRINNESFAAGDEATLDEPKTLELGCQRRQMRVPPDSVAVHGGTL